MQHCNPDRITAIASELYTFNIYEKQAFLLHQAP